MNKDIFGLMKYSALVFLAPILSLELVIFAFFAIFGTKEHGIFIDNLIFVSLVFLVLSPFVFLVVVPTIFAIKNHWSNYLDWFFDHKLLMTILLPILCPYVCMFLFEKGNFFDDIFEWVCGLLFLIIIIAFFAIFTIEFFRVKKKKIQEIFFYILFCISVALIFAFIVFNSKQFMSTCFVVSLSLSFCYLTIYLTVMGYEVFRIFKK